MNTNKKEEFKQRRIERNYIFKRNIKVRSKDFLRDIKRSKFLSKIMLPILVLVIFFIRIYVSDTADDLVIDNLNLSLVFLGVVLTIISIDDSRRLQEANFLVELNKTFVENETYTRVYEHLENSLKGVKDNTEPLKSYEISQYLTFFETLYILVRENAASIDEFDDLFEYRFFLAINDDEIWKKKLSNRNNFINIYELENRWFNFRTDRGLPILGKVYKVGSKSLLEERLEKDEFRL